jgi:nucleotide-binding universal stress UspA family protein
MITAVHVEPTNSPISAESFDGFGALLRAADDAADSAHLECELALAGATVAWRFERRSGDAPSEICRLADELGASAIVVGRSRRRRQIFRHRSTRARIVEVASQPVLVVPEPEPCAAHG